MQDKERRPMRTTSHEGNRCRMHFGHANKLKTHGRTTIKAQAERKQERALLNEMKAVNAEIEQIMRDQGDN
jgi:hypothetical protein